MESIDPEFLKQLGGSGAANVLTIVGIGLFMLLKRTNCNHKRSKCKSCCFSLEYDDKTLRGDTINGEKEEPERTDESSSESDDEEGVPRLHGKHRSRLRAESV